MVRPELLLIFLTKMRKFVEKRVTLFYYGISVLYHSAERTTCDCIKNLSVDVSENGSDILFLHHIKEGAASKSYGIHVAKIAGIPYQVRRGAQAKLQELEAGEAASRTGRGISNEQISIFDQVASPEPEADNSLELYKDAMDTVRSVDVNQITPVKALNILCTLQEQIKEIDQIDQIDQTDTE